MKISGGQDEAATYSRVADRVEGGLRTIGRHSREHAPDRPLVSVVTVVRNGVGHIESAIRSVLAQSYDNIEYIIVDGASTDGTLDIIRKYEDRIQYWISEPDAGIYDAMNKGVSFSTGELVGLINSDDYYESDAILKVVNAYRMQGVTQRAILYGNYYVLDEALNVKTGLISDLKIWKGMSVCHQTMFVTRDIYQTLSLYDTRLKYAADYAFFITAIRAGVRFVHTGEYLVTFSNTGATYSNVLSSYRESLSVLRRQYGVVSRQFMMFLFFQVIKSLVVTVVKTGLSRVLSRSVLARVKIIYNRISRRVSYKV